MNSVSDLREEEKLKVNFAQAQEIILCLSTTLFVLYQLKSTNSKLCQPMEKILDQLTPGQPAYGNSWLEQVQSAILLRYSFEPTEWQNAQRIVFEMISKVLQIIQNPCRSPY